ELKIHSTDQTLWDIYKLLGATISADRVQRVVVIAAKRTRFSRRCQGGELFQTPDIPPWIERTSDMMSGWRKAWVDCLAGLPGSAPTALPDRILIQPLFAGELHNTPGYELRAILVSEPENSGRFSTIDGWPVGVAPP